MHVLLVLLLRLFAFSFVYCRRVPPSEAVAAAVPQGWDSFMGSTKAPPSNTFHPRAVADPLALFLGRRGRDRAHAPPVSARALRQMGEGNRTVAAEPLPRLTVVGSCWT